MTTQTVTPESYRRLPIDNGGGRCRAGQRPPTPRQVAFLRFHWEFAQSMGRWPTVRETMAALGLGSPNAVVNARRALAAKGYLALGPGGESHRCGLAGVRLVPAVLDTPEGRRLAEALGLGEATRAEG